MKRKLLAYTVLFLSVLLTSTAAWSACDADNWKDCAGKPWVVGNTMETPIGEKWWPNKQWGPNDEAGSTNFYTDPEVVKRALAEAKEGRIYSLGHPYTSDMPLLSTRSYQLRIPGTPTGGPTGSNKLVYHDEFVAAEIGQVGTQFDGLGHVGVQVGEPGDQRNMRYYNGVTELEMASESGLKKNGVEKLHPIAARGILIDAAGLKGVDAMEVGQEITMADVRAALKRQGMEDFKFMPGDYVIFRTGWTKYWIKDNKKYNSGEPGIGIEVAKWLVDEVKVGGYGGDTPATEVLPNPDPACGVCLHSYLITRNGIVNQENMDLEEIARDKVYHFLYVFVPVPLAGATGSPGAPIAIK